MGCVIIAVCGEKKHGILRRKTIIKHLYYNNHSGGADVIFLPYTENEMNQMSCRRIRRIAKRTADMTGNNVVYCGMKNFKNILSDYGVRYCDGSAVVIKFIGEVIRRIAKDRGINLMSECIGVYDYPFCGNTVDTVMNLSKYCKDIVVYTKNIEKAENMLDYVTESTGMPIVVTEDYSDWSKKCRIAVFMSDITQSIGNNKIVGVDVFGRVKNDGIKMIKEIEFYICDDFCDIFEITNGIKNQEMVEFTIKSGASLVFGKDIKISGYR